MAGKNDEPDKGWIKEDTLIGTEKGIFDASLDKLIAEGYVEEQFVAGEDEPRLKITAKGEIYLAKLKERR